MDKPPPDRKAPTRTHNTWTRHYQIVWENRAHDYSLPLWLRLACIAYARHEANGHANFKRGQLSWILGTPPKGDQPFKRVDRWTLSNALALAIRREWIADGSCTECLVVPGHAIEGPDGDATKPCTVHVRKQLGKKRVQLRVVPDAGA
jgi:hypothetical protein